MFYKENDWLKISDYNNIYFFVSAEDFDDFFDPAEEFDEYFNLGDGLNRYGLVFVVGQSQKKKNLHFKATKTFFARNCENSVSS